ncbi:hypothetical protein ACTFQN_06795 [Bacillus cereus group sp. MYBK30-1]|uniref:hypothetical protein n=1 Tax=unclassified Bacillus cereus group TaxID=2750818 RepID=UPI003F7A444F
MHSKDDSSKNLYENKYQYCPTCEGDRIHIWHELLQIRHSNELVLRSIPGEKITDLLHSIPAHIDEKKNDEEDKLLQICVCDGCKESLVFAKKILVHKTVKPEFSMHLDESLKRLDFSKM